MTDTILSAYAANWIETLQSPMMVNAFLAGILIALASGAMGYFTISRQSTFAAHALAHIGLPGATLAALIGWPVPLGMGLFAVGGGLAIGSLGKKANQREIATGTVLAFATGLGLFFTHYSSKATQQMQSILFGSILTITGSELVGFALFDAVLLIVVSIIFRPLLFSSVDEQVARAKGVPIALLNIVFMALMAGVITVAVPAVGTLLVFALVITPAAAASILTKSAFKAIAAATFICLACIWLGLLVSTILDTPPSFIIVTFSTLTWLTAQAVAAIRSDS